MASKNYKALFEEALLRSQNNQDPAMAQLEAEIMKQDQGASIAPTLALVDHFTGSNFASQAPKRVSKKEQLAQLLQLRQGQQSQRLGGLGKLADMQGRAEDRAAERAFREKMFALQAESARAKALRPPKMGSEDKKALGYTQSLQRDLQAYRKAVKSGGLRPGMWTDLVGDTPVTALRKALVENYGRLQSGGAISGDEEKRFGSLFGSMMDSPEIIEQKLKRIEEEIASKNALYGGSAFNPSAQRMPSSNNVDVDSMDEAQLDAFLAMYGG